MAAIIATATVFSGCMFQHQAPPPQLFDLAEGQVYGPVLPSPITIRLGQSTLDATGSVGPPDEPEGSPAIWEGHALGLEPDSDGNRSLFFWVEGDALQNVTLQVNDQDPIVEDQPGAYLSGQLSMVRWLQDYSLRVAAEDREGAKAEATIFVNGEDAHIEGDQADPPLRMRLLRLDGTNTRMVRGVGFQGKLYRHPWPTCGTDCDPTTQGGALVAMISGPADTVALILDERIPYFATGLSYWPNPDFTIVAIPVRDQNNIEVAVLSGAGEFVAARWDRPAG